MKYDRFVGSAPVAIECVSNWPVYIFEINDEEAISAYYKGNGTYTDFRKTKIHDSFIMRHGTRHMLSDIVKVGSPWLSDAPICKQIV